MGWMPWCWSLQFQSVGNSAYQTVPLLGLIKFSLFIWTRLAFMQDQYTLISQNCSAVCRVMESRSIAIAFRSFVCALRLGFWLRLTFGRRLHKVSPEVIKPWLGHLHDWLAAPNQGEKRLVVIFVITLNFLECIFEFAAQFQRCPNFGSMVTPFEKNGSMNQASSLGRVHFGSEDTWVSKDKAKENKTHVRVCEGLQGIVKQIPMPKFVP